MKILGMEIKIESVESNKVFKDDTVSHYGQNDGLRGIITLNKEMSEDVKGNTLLHEVIHLLDYNLSLGFSEAQINTLASGLYCVLKENGLNFNIAE